MKTHIVTYAQNLTPVHPTFWLSLLAAKKHTKATLHVIEGRYKNPTSRWSRDSESQEVWADEVQPYATRRRFNICRGLKVFGDISTQPTASRPLSDLEGFLGKNSGILGHPKRALEMVATESRRPRVMLTTGACTIANYTDSKAGKKGAHHHVLGALIVEVNDDGTLAAIPRHVSANANGCFTDLDTFYTPEGVQKAPPALTLTLGDYHSGREDEAVLEATERLCELVRPRELYLHDLFDFSARNHHQHTHEERYDHRHDTVEGELKGAVSSIHRVAGWKAKRVVIVRSNHDEAFERWLNDTKVPERDPDNEAYWCEVRARRRRLRTGPGKGWPDAFPMEAKRLGVPSKVRFLRRNDKAQRLGVEHAFHGDKGLNGSRGTWQTYVKLGVKVTAGHTHVPRIADGYYGVGLTAELDHGYNLLPSQWAHAHVVLHADGKRQLIFIFQGNFCGKDRKAA